MARCTRTSSKAAVSSASVASFEPSLTTMTSCSRVAQPSSERTDSTIPASSLKAGTSTETGGVSGEAMASATPSWPRSRRWRVMLTQASAVNARWMKFSTAK